MALNPRCVPPMQQHILFRGIPAFCVGAFAAFYVRERSGGMAGWFGSRVSRSFPQDVFLSCSTEWIMAVETLEWVQSHPNCFMKFASL